ncbi:MAG TPA: cation diffusion facilitator family transporter [Cytophagaceae bacterium]|jgi:cation diffusion facilitator family transporter
MNQENQQSKEGVRKVLLGMIVNFLLAIIKGVAGFFGNSYALIADAIESASDVFSSLVVLAGLQIASKAPDKDHPYGHGKAEPIAALIVSTLLAAAAVVIVIQSIHQIQTPHDVPATFTLLILLGVVVVKEVLYRTVLKTASDLGSNSMTADAWHHRSDAITSAAAFVGISIAVIGGKDYASADDWAALVAAAIIFYNVYKIFRSAFSEIMDTSPSEEIIEGVRKVALTVPGVVALDKTYLRKMGIGYYVDIHVVVDGKISVCEGHDIAHLVKDKLIGGDSKIHDVLVHIEPA